MSIRGILFLSIQPSVMVHYIRFLKPPRIQTTDSAYVTIKSLITITNDLGDEFYPGDLILIADLVPTGIEIMRPTVQRMVLWTSGMRTVWITMERISLKVHWPVQLHIARSNARTDSPSVETFPDVLSAWSESFGIGSNTQASRRVERRFELTPGNMLRIYEDAGESIARHVWWVDHPIEI